MSGTYEIEEDYEDEGDSQNCPFCDADTCVHYAATLDLTERQVLGGALYRACEDFIERESAKRLAVIKDADEDADDESEVFYAVFDELEAVLDDLSELTPAECESHGGPGQASAMKLYWAMDPSDIPRIEKKLEGSQLP